ALTARYTQVPRFIADFVVTDAMMAEMVKVAEEAGVPLDEEGLRRSQRLIALRIKALIARDLWDTSAYWQVVNADNPVDASFQTASEALTDNAFQRLGMARH